MHEHLISLPEQPVVQLLLLVQLRTAGISVAPVVQTFLLLISHHYTEDKINLQTVLQICTLINHCYITDRID